MPIGKRAEIMLEHGDMYVMSEKAVGTDWKNPSIPTLRHAAGSKKFLNWYPSNWLLKRMESKGYRKD